MSVDFVVIAGTVLKCESEDKEEVVPPPNPSHSNSRVPVWHENSRTGWRRKIQTDCFHPYLTARQVKSQFDLCQGIKSKQNIMWKKYMYIIYEQWQSGWKKGREGERVQMKGCRWKGPAVKGSGERQNHDTWWDQDLKAVSPSQDLMREWKRKDYKEALGVVAPPGYASDHTKPTVNYFDCFSPSFPYKHKAAD